MEGVAANAGQHSHTDTVAAAVAEAAATGTTELTPLESAIPPQITPGMVY